MNPPPPPPVVVPIAGIARHICLTETQKCAGDDLARHFNVRASAGGSPGHAALHRAVCSGMLEIRVAGTPAEEPGQWMRWNRRKKQVEPARCRGAKD